VVRGGRVYTDVDVRVAAIDLTAVGRPEHIHKPTVLPTADSPTPESPMGRR
jgi:hypothetical protein